MYAVNLNKDVYNGAARYAQKHNVSVESFIETLIINAVKEKPKFDYKSEDYKKARMEYLTEKYGL